MKEEDKSGKGIKLASSEKPHYGEILKDLNSGEAKNWITEILEVATELYRENNPDSLKLETRQTGTDFSAYALVDQAGEEKVLLESRPIYVEGYGQGIHIRNQGSERVYQDYREYVWQALHSQI